MQSVLSCATRALVRAAPARGASARHSSFAAPRAAALRAKAPAPMAATRYFAAAANQVRRMP
jgi:hypothetical protein